MEFWWRATQKLAAQKRAERRLKSPLAIGANGRMVGLFFDWPHADLILSTPRKGCRQKHTLGVLRIRSLVRVRRCPWRMNDPPKSRSKQTNGNTEEMPLAA